ncbi:MAG TPA: CxxxxCH/CxxCH domain-containing protein, partial [Anaeromyxobacter sp.]
HGDKSATGATLYYMMQKQLVEKPVAAFNAMWGTPQAAGFAAAYEFNPAIYGATTVWEFQDYYMGGLCTKCHVAWNGTTGVKYYYSTGTYTATVPHDGGGSLRNRCSDCHVHPMGCGGCHNAPPTSGVHDRHDQVLAADQKVNYSAAASEATETLYGFRCVKCHNGTHANEANDPVLGKSSTNPYQVELNFDSAYDPKNAPTAAYTRSGAWSSYQGTNGDYWGWTPAGTCASVYCHSNGAPADVAASYAAAITWQPQGTWSCGSCHGTQAATGSMSKAHALHTGTGGYGFTCEKCHASVAASPTLLTTTVVGGGKMLHVNGVKDVQFDAYLGNSTGGSYGAGRTCSNTYCHSNGTDRTTSNGTTTPPSIAWTSTGVSTCRYCHGGDATDLTKSIGTSPDTGSAKHANHVNKASVIGTNFGCVSCHAATVTANTVIGTKTNHVNAIANVSFAPITGPVSGASRAVGTYSAGCAATWCHSDGRDSPNTSFAPVTWTDTAWNSTAICKGCHGRSTSVAGEPDHATANSHPKHVSASTGASACYDCHRTTVTVAGTAIATTNLHLNGDRDVQMASGTYAMATKTCSNISCHNGGTATWGTTLACADCHSSTNDVDNWNINDGIPAAISTAEWTYSGHGATAAYTSGNPAAGFAGTNPCVYCHDASVSHKLSTNPFRLLNTGGADGQNGNCLICHKTGSPGYTPSGYTAKNRTTSRAVDSTHYGSDHTGTVGASNGGKFCWDCHDPHGDRTSAGGNIYMIHSNVAKQTDGTYGLPTASTTVATVFTAHTTGTDYVRLSSPFNGLCQVCHSVTNHYLSTVADPGPHNSGANCTASCHPHTDSAFTVNEAFKNKGGACTTCHAAQTGSAPRIRARIVGGAAGSEGDDFIRKSRHVSNGTTTSIVTDYDCILCHAEGDLSSNGSGATAIIKTIAANHGGDSGTTTVDLRNVDSAGGTGIAVAWPGQRLQTFTATTAQRDGMDSFCMGCHDSNGASAVAVNKNNPANGMLYSGTTPPTLAQALKPFNVNDNLRNGNEPTTSIIDSSAANSIPTWRTTTNGKIINVKGDGGSLVGFNSGNAVGTGWASHHNLNQFTRRYTTNLTGWTAIWKAYTTKEGVVLNSTAANAGWAAGLHCSDCHLNESNAHGARNAFYMLSDSTGGDVLPASSGTASSTDVCAKCHNPFSSTRYTHGADNSHIVSQKNGSVTLGAASNAAAYLMCLECHAGGAPGAIHGMNGTYKPFNSSTWTSKQYRFQGGGGTWRWYSPNASATGSDATWATSGGSFGCYTQSSGQVDAFGGGCTQHGSGTSSTFNGTGSRPLSY